MLRSSSILYYPYIVILWSNVRVPTCSTVVIATVNKQHFSCALQVVEPDELARATFEPQLSSFNNPGPAIKAFEAYTSIEAPAAKPAYTPTKADGTKRQRLEGEGV